MLTLRLQRGSEGHASMSARLGSEGIVCVGGGEGEGLVVEFIMWFLSWGWRCLHFLVVVSVVVVAVVVCLGFGGFFFLGYSVSPPPPPPPPPPIPVYNHRVCGVGGRS